MAMQTAIRGFMIEEIVTVKRGDKEEQVPVGSMIHKDTDFDDARLANLKADNPIKLNKQEYPVYRGDEIVETKVIKFYQPAGSSATAEQVEVTPIPRGNIAAADASIAAAQTPTRVQV